MQTEMQCDTILPCSVATPRFRVGDRVTRPIDVYKAKSPLRHGEVVNVYAKWCRHFGFYAELYTVCWDGNGVENYLPHGIDPEYLPHGIDPEDTAR